MVNSVFKFRMFFNKVLLESFVVSDNPILFGIGSEELFQGCKNVSVESFDVILITPTCAIQWSMFSVMTDAIEMELVAAKDKAFDLIVFQKIKDGEQCRRSEERRVG